jgi:hypothetical protein
MPATSAINAALVSAVHSKRSANSSCVPLAYARCLDFDSTANGFCSADFEGRADKLR